MRYIVGIDEAGRGPLAGPVAVGAVLVRTDFPKNFWKGIKDSKKLKEADRELWFKLLLEGQSKGEIDFHVALISEKVIDARGISYAIKAGIEKCLEELEVSSDTQIFLDGGLKAPEEFIHQLSVIKGDEKIPIISLASIAAKVIRDRRMLSLGRKFPLYGFEIHKGYGTRIHLEKLRSMGICPCHRKTFTSHLTRRR